MTDEPEELTVTSGEVVSEPVASGEWLAPPAAADRLGMSERTLWRLVKQGRYQKRVENRRAEILVPLPVTGATAPETETTEHIARQAPGTLMLAVITELKDRRQQDADTIARLTARLTDLERENAVLQERTLSWRERFRRWFG